MRAPYFMSNWAAVLPAARDGVLPTFIRPDKQIPTVSTEDIGAQAAKLLVEGSSEPIVEITGPREYSPDDIARVLSTLLARPVTSLALPNETVVPTFTSMGITPDFAELFRQLYAGIDGDKLPWLHTTSVVRGTTTIEIEIELARLVAG